MGLSYSKMYQLSNQGQGIHVSLNLAYLISLILNFANGDEAIKLGLISFPHK